MSHADDFETRHAAWLKAEANALAAQREAKLAITRQAPADEIDLLTRQAQQLRMLANEMHDAMLLSLRGRTALN